TWEEFQKLPAVDQVIDFHCVTGWTVLNLPTRGVPVKSLLALAQPTAAAGFVVFDCEHGYTTNIDLAEAMKDNVHIELFLWGAPLPDKYGGPARGRVPDRYGYKSGKWVTGLRVLAADEPGFWETKGYSNTADPWTEDRYA
ncbi:MAG: molybdopterin-dependent oxidoreductase, partial [Deltaproteobacteria bacterium]|nr:molybdopterin-dependent oxidoreductase [Deltaproteobacteria bacterium]